MASYKIIIIEDDESIRNLYKLKLQYENFVVFVAKNGQEGLKAIKKHTPDLVLLDLRMPIMNGDEMLQKLRSTDWGAHTRVVVLTNLSKDEAPHSLRFLNVDRYIVKAHHTPAQIVRIIKEILP